MFELQNSLKDMENNKTAGLDGIPPEVWKTDMFNHYLINFCNNVWQDIDAWREGCILPFLKKVDLGIPSNYRGITLIAIAVKIYNKLLLNCIQSEVKKILCKSQNRFQKNRSTVGQILPTQDYNQKTLKHQWLIEIAGEKE